MARKANIHGGGAQTTMNGLGFEQETSLDEALIAAGFTIGNFVISKNGKRYGMSVPKQKLDSKFLKPNGIDYRKYNSKGWNPDECFINELNKTAFIIEKKFQKKSGSVDEKLAGCEFKKQEYEKLFSPLGYSVVYLYVFNDWFKNPRYTDFLEYIDSKNCPFFFNEIPLDFLGLI